LLVRWTSGESVAVATAIKLDLDIDNTSYYYMANWSKMERRILICSLSGKMDRSRISFGELLFQNIAQKKTVMLLSRNLFFFPS
jgi:hypothetical protein